MPSDSQLWPSASKCTKRDFRVCPAAAATIRWDGRVLSGSLRRTGRRICLSSYLYCDIHAILADRLGRQGKTGGILSALSLSYSLLSGRECARARHNHRQHRILSLSIANFVNGLRRHSAALLHSDYLPYCVSFQLITISRHNATSQWAINMSRRSIVRLHQLCLSQAKRAKPINKCSIGSRARSVRAIASDDYDHLHWTHTVR